MCLSALSWFSSSFLVSADSESDPALWGPQACLRGSKRRRGFRRWLGGRRQGKKTVDLFKSSSLTQWQSHALAVLIKADCIITFYKRLPPPWWTFCLVTSCYISLMLKQMYRLQYISLTNLCCVHKKGRFYLPSNLFRFERNFKSFLVPVDCYLLETEF